MVGLAQKCDSCGEMATLLVPVRVLEEYSWGSEMVTKYYCITCFAKLIHDENWNNEDEDEEEEP